MNGSIYSVGMDIPDLNTLVLATPRKEIEQSVGRILRKTKDDKDYVNPMIIDIVDKFYYLYYQARARKKFYANYDYEIQHIRMMESDSESESESESEENNLELLTDSEEE